ncbi:MAG: hypothetical protein E5X51_17515 [Mesorhizobium sp.]|uniref:hypothetical protein n=1 Tax=Mesorhizobium sp. TaxID=1871066 RepID=UPI0011F86D74|nr:hypothetical protein [Mesorhizobium sp.]TIQ20187.1 MAG: hypothetical protein E5X51_17515 [Mesorhizobium sp.]
MQSTEIITLHSLSEFEGPEFEAPEFEAPEFEALEFEALELGASCEAPTIFGAARRFGVAPACASAQAGYIISHQNR